MDASLTERRRVKEEGPRVVNFCQVLGVGALGVMTKALEEATAKYVPAAAVIHMWRALFGITGHKGFVGGCSSQM